MSIYHHNTWQYQTFIRTDPSVMKLITEGLNNKKSCIEIYQDMVLQDPDNALKDLQQVHTKKHYNKTQISHAAKANIADEVLQILSMVNDHDFVKEVVYTQDNSKPPSIICYTSEQIADIKKHFQADPSTVLGVDRTFNLGSVFVTNFVYKNKKVISKSTCDHPIFIDRASVFPLGRFHGDLPHFLFTLQSSDTNRCAMFQRQNW
ncbi:unnamed protein product [Mytilus coruscus]|uniref:Uncharacterized protein n=1 Tax=Mytilus coruscus TaxID=42192 RepID=A0A6J8AUD4_MYTCO|nr:unnamed protein product [Mytilus coruscus]